MHCLAGDFAIRVCVLASDRNSFETDFALCIARLGISRSVAGMRTFDVLVILVGECTMLPWSFEGFGYAGVVLSRPFLVMSPGLGT